MKKEIAGILLSLAVIAIAVTLLVSPGKLGPTSTGTAGSSGAGTGSVAIDSGAGPRFPCDLRNYTKYWYCYTPARKYYTGVVKIPDNTLIMGSGSESPRYSLDRYPTSIYLDDIEVLITNIRITRSEVTGVAIDTRTGKKLEHISFLWEIMFYRKSEGLGFVNVLGANPFKMDRPPETSEADGIVFSFV